MSENTVADTSISLEKLPIFISWSQNLSREVSSVLKAWLSQMFQTANPWMSSDDIAKGTFWTQAVVEKLRSARVGIVVITPANITRPWLNFELGALSQAIGSRDGITAPLLVNLPATALIGHPALTLQVTNFEKNDFFKLVEMVNARLPFALEREDLRREYEFKWPSLKEQVQVLIKQAEESDAANVRPESRTIDDVAGSFVDQVSQIRQELAALRPHIPRVERDRAMSRAISNEVEYHIARAIPVEEQVFSQMGLSFTDDGVVKVDLFAAEVSEEQKAAVWRELGSVPKFRCAFHTTQASFDSRV